jgi:ABC-type glycerol-3-phosphate transport system permease component
MLLNDSLLVPSAIIWIDQYLMMILMTVIIELLMMMMRGYTISLSKQVAQSVRMD